MAGLLTGSSSFTSALRDAAANLEGCGVTYMFTGALAVGLYAVPRTTFDAEAQRACFEKGFILEEEGVDRRASHPWSGSCG